MWELESLTVNILWGLSYSTVPDLGYRFVALLETVHFAGLTTSENSLDRYHDLNSMGLAPCKHDRSPGDIGSFKRRDITPSVSVPPCPQAAKDLGLLWRPFGREKKDCFPEVCHQYRHNGISKGRVC